MRESRSVSSHNMNKHMNLIEGSGRWNIVDNPYNGNAWSRFTSIHSENLYIFRTITASLGEWGDVYTCLYSLDDALFVQNIYIEILWVCTSETWPSIPVVSVKKIYYSKFYIFSTVSSWRRLILVMVLNGTFHKAAASPYSRVHINTALILR